MRKGKVFKMASQKLTSESGNSPKPNTGRRSFIWKTGAGLSAVLASAVAGMSKTKAEDDKTLKDQVGRLSARIGILEDANAIRNLHENYAACLDQGMYEDVMSLFAEDVEVYFNGGLFVGRDTGVRRLYLNHFSEGHTGKRLELSPECQRDSMPQQESIEVAMDRQSAKARFPFSMRVGIPMTEDSTLVQMARLQGQGIVHWNECGIYENSYVKVGDVWKIKRIEYRTILQAKHALGWAYAEPISIPLFSKAFPQNPTGPDKLIAPVSGNLA
jgi:hypothetical protein